jgi:hypothetical protein
MTKCIKNVNRIEGQTESKGKKELRRQRRSKNMKKV